MLYECTDCENCISVDTGFRIACGASNLAADRVFEYLPLGNYDAARCPEFEEGDPHGLSWKDMDEALRLAGADTPLTSALRKYVEWKAKLE